MCGIVGAVFKQGVNENLIKEMIGLLAHRGPDEQSVHLEGSVALGFARLSIIDPLQGHQPIFNEDKSVVIQCNGEIYNHLEEREALSKQGHDFGSHSDAEVIPHLYETHGESFVEHLDGMFSIALLDRQSDKLILVRDRLGIKPLYFLETDSGFYFSSEMKAFLVVPDYEPSVDRLAFDQMLTFKHVPGDRCLLANIRCVLPGHSLVMDLGNHSFCVKPYYQIPNRPQRKNSVNVSAVAAEVRSLLDDAVERRLMSDVPLGVALSGGLDSSAIVASAARVTDQPLKTFFVNIGEGAGESEFARMVADRYKTDHEEFNLVPDELKEIVPRVMWHVEEPMSVAEISTYYLGKMASKFVKVLLCGEGSDELFGGYSRFQPLNMFSVLPKPVLEWGYVRGLNGFTRGQRKQLASNEQRPFVGPNGSTNLDAFLNNPGESKLSQFLRYELAEQLPNLHLMRVDKLIMAHSVEARVPFLDTRLVDYVANLPAALKVQGIREKVLLKLAMKERLPQAIIDRRKLGFSNPVKALFQGEFRHTCYAELCDAKATLEPFFSFLAIEKLFASLGGKGLLSQPEMKIFHIYLFLKWHQVFVEGGFRSLAK